MMESFSVTAIQILASRTGAIQESRKHKPPEKAHAPAEYRRSGTGSAPPIERLQTLRSTGSCAQVRRGAADLPSGPGRGPGPADRGF